jgi:glycolate oxidase iron-sulfur subunit
VALLTGCVQRVFFPHVNAATVRVLAAEGCDVLAPAAQGCCGALSLHSGRLAEAERYADRVFADFAGVDAIVANAAGCGSALKEHGGSNVRDLAEFLVELGPVAPRHPLPLTVAYQDACHLAHAQGVRVQPRTLLRAIADLDLRELAEPDLCCGSAGIYNILQPAPARELAERKAAHIAATGAAVLVSANPGCLMQLSVALERAGHPVRAVHLAEVLDASIRGYPVGQLSSVP